MTKWIQHAGFVLAILTGSWTFAADLPNILIIMGDDIGWTNVSAYGSGIVGYDTPNIDRIAREGMRFTDYYGEQSLYCGAFGIHHWTKPSAHRVDQGGYAGRRHWHSG